MPLWELGKKVSKSLADMVKGTGESGTDVNKADTAWFVVE